MSERFLDSYRPSPLREAPKPRRGTRWDHVGWAFAGIFIGVGVYALTWGGNPLWGVGLIAVGLWTARRFWEV